MAKTSLHTHTAVARLPGVSYIGFLVTCGNHMVRWRTCKLLMFKKYTLALSRSISDILTRRVYELGATRHGVTLNNISNVINSRLLGRV